MDNTIKKKVGRPKEPAKDYKPTNVRFTPAEQAIIDNARGSKKRATYIHDVVIQIASITGAK